MFKGLAPVPKQESASLRNLRRKYRKKRRRPFRHWKETVVRSNKTKKRSEKDEIRSWCCYATSKNNKLIFLNTVCLWQALLDTCNFGKSFCSVILKQNISLLMVIWNCVKWLCPMILKNNLCLWTLLAVIWSEANLLTTILNNQFIWPMMIVVMWQFRLNILKKTLDIKRSEFDCRFVELFDLVIWNFFKLLKTNILNRLKFIRLPRSDFCICLFLLAACERLLLKRLLFGCMIVPTNSEESTTSNSSDSTESSMEETMPAHEIPHEFIVNDKIHNKGPEKGEKYQTVSLCVFPYMFRKRYTRKDITTFTCNGCEKFRQATIATAKLDEDNDWFLLTNPSKHLCSPSSTAHQKAEFSRKLYQKVAEDPRASLPKLYDELKMSMITGMDTETRKSFLKKISKFANIKRGLYQFRKHFIPRNPDKQEGFDAKHAWLNISKKESLIKGDIPVDGGRVLILSSVKSLKRLARAYAFAVDGTFKICPRLWYQLIVINAQIGPNTWVPVCYGYLPNKKLATYNEFFKGVTDYMVKHNISKDGDVLAAQYVMADWEINLRKALKLAFPRVEIKGW